MEFDYKKLLMAYLRHIGLCEGIDYLPLNNEDEPMDWLTTEEVEELKRLSALTDERYKESTYE